MAPGIWLPYWRVLQHGVYGRRVGLVCRNCLIVLCSTQACETDSFLDGDDMEPESSKNSMDAFASVDIYIYEG